MSIDFKARAELNRLRLERQREIWNKKSLQILWDDPKVTVLFQRGPVTVKLFTHTPRRLEIEVGNIISVNSVTREMLTERKALYAVIRKIIRDRVKVERREGALVGRKCLILKNGILISPSQGTPWNGLSLEADREVRKDHRHGIYALWPLRSKELLCQELQGYYGFGDTVIVELLGHGVSVIGEKGWRAQKVTVVKMWADKTLIEEAKKHFGLYVPVVPLYIPLELIFY